MWVTGVNQSQCNVLAVVKYINLTMIPRSCVCLRVFRLSREPFVVKTWKEAFRNQERAVPLGTLFGPADCICKLDGGQIYKHITVIFNVLSCLQWYLLTSEWCSWSTKLSHFCYFYIPTLSHHRPTIITIWQESLYAHKPINKYKDMFQQQCTKNRNVFI